MKTPEMQIVAKLQAYHEADVLTAIGLYQNDSKIRQQLFTKSWAPQPEPPKNREFYYIGGEYWVQSDEARQRDIEAAKAKKKSQPVKRQNSLELTFVDYFKCPECGGDLYKQRIKPCNKDGKAGYRIRLICGENADHEVLL